MDLRSYFLRSLSSTFRGFSSAAGPLVLLLLVVVTFLRQTCRRCLAFGNVGNGEGTRYGYGFPTICVHPQIFPFKSITSKQDTIKYLCYIPWDHKFYRNTIGLEMRTTAYLCWSAMLEARAGARTAERRRRVSSMFIIRRDLCSWWGSWGATLPTFLWNKSLLLGKI